MRPSRKDEDLSGEPSLREMLADPVIQALMARDGVSEEELVQLSLAARTRLARTRDAVVMPFPGPSHSGHSRSGQSHPANAGSASGPVRAEPERRPRTRWPFEVRAAELKQAD